MSATAHMWASTHNHTLEEKMNAVIAALAACQNKIGSGYLSAFPSELFDRFEAIKPVWAPYYTIHKVGELSQNVIKSCYFLHIGGDYIYYSIIVDFGGPPGSIHFGWKRASIENGYLDGRVFLQPSAECD